jgi:ATP-dependent exoDNAse (exonuclease V) alpha subunit
MSLINGRYGLIWEKELVLVYPGRKVHDVLPQFANTKVIKPTAEQRALLLAYVATEYPAGRSLRELAELTGRTQTAIRRALDEMGVSRRRRGAATIADT